MKYLLGGLCFVSLAACMLMYNWAQTTVEIANRVIQEIS